MLADRQQSAWWPPYDGDDDVYEDAEIFQVHINRHKGLVVSAAQWFDDYSEPVAWGVGIWYVGVQQRGCDNLGNVACVVVATAWHQHRNTQGYLVEEWREPSRALYTTALSAIAALQEDGSVLLRNVHAADQVAWSGQGMDEVCMGCKYAVYYMCLQKCHLKYTGPANDSTNHQPFPASHEYGAWSRGPVGCACGQ